MNTPPFLAGATMLFWGWQTGLLPLAAIMALLLEGSRFARARWEFSQPDLDRIWNFCILLFLGAAVYAFSAGEGVAAISGSMGLNNPRSRVEVLTRSVRAVFLFFQWMPIYFFPIMAAQAWGQQQNMDLSTFSWWLRRKRQTARTSLAVPKQRESGHHSPLMPRRSKAQVSTMHDAARATLNVSYPFFAICLLGASAARARSPGFPVILLLLLAWGFWSRRPRSFSGWAWAASLASAAVLGLVTQQGLFYLEETLQRFDNALMARFGRNAQFDVTQTRTMLGRVGRLKLSGRIVLRLKTENEPPPLLLRESSYNLFKSPVWGSSKRDFGPLVPEDDEGTWLLATNQNATHSVIIASLLPGGRGLLPLPQGSAQLERLPVFLLEKNRLGAVRSEAGPGYIEFRARYGSGVSIDDPPGPEDLQVPAIESPALGKIAGDLKLQEKSGEEVVNALTDFFAQQFEYSTWLGDDSARNLERNPIAQFLLERRRGHCEYFATATTLLLRYAGIPARYAIGYAVPQHKGNQFTVRARDAHAWCLAWVDGAWQEVDTTPAAWPTIEAGFASFWEPISDAWSRLWFAFSKWRWGQTQWRKYLIWAIVLPLLGTTARVVSSKGWRRVRGQSAFASGRGAAGGLDSEFYVIERLLTKRGFARHSGETATAWLDRLHHTGVQLAGLHDLVALHYRLRFDPHGISPAERTALTEQSTQWLSAWDRQRAAPRNS